MIDCILYYTDDFSFMKSHLSIVSPNSCVPGVLFRKPFSTSVNSSAFSTFSSVRVSALTLRSLICLELSFVQGEKQESNFNHSLNHPIPFVKYAVFSLMYIRKLLQLNL